MELRTEPQLQKYEKAQKLYGDSDLKTKLLKAEYDRLSATNEAIKQQYKKNVKTVYRINARILQGSRKVQIRDLIENPYNPLQMPYIDFKEHFQSH